MKVNFFHTAGIAYNSKHNVRKNDDTYVPQSLSYAQNPFLKGLDALQNYNLSFLGKTTSRPVLAIDREMNYKPYDSANQAGTILGIASQRISKCIKEDKEKRAKYAGDYCFIPLCEVQIVKEDGTLGIDEDKVREVYEAAEIARNKGTNNDRPKFYGMNEDKIPVPFMSYPHAKEVTHAKRPNIIKCLNGDNKTSHGYIFFKPEEIETIDDDGKIGIDKEKLDVIIKRAEEYLSNPYIGEQTPIYALYIGTENKKDTRFDGIIKAKKKLEVSYEGIAACLSGSKKFAGDWCYAPASEIETIKEDGTIEIDTEKIKELKETAKIAKENDTNMQGKAVYAYRIKDKSLKRYDISADAAHLLKISPANISTCLAHRCEIASGFIFLPAYKIEVKNEDGILVPDKRKLRAALKEHHKIVTAYKAEKARKNAEAKNTEDKKVNTSENKPKTTATKDEKDSKDKPVPLIRTNQVFISKPATEIKTNSLAINVYRKTKTKKSTSQPDKPEKPKAAITKTKTKAKVEDPEKLKAKYTALGRIYAYKPSGDYIEFEDLFIASAKLDIDLDILYRVIKNNSNKIKGYMFATDADC